MIGARQRIGRSQADLAERLRLHQRHGDGDELIRRLEPAADVELQVRRRAERRLRRAREHARGHRRTRQLGLAVPADRQLQVILEVLSDAGDVRDHRNAVRLQVIRGTNSRQHQQLR